MADIPVCPIMSVATAEANALCVQEDCALYLTGANRCSLVYIGYKALMEVQEMQKKQG